MTVESLEVAHKIVNENPEGVAAVYSYNHVITGKQLWSIESWANQGCTCASEYVINPVLIYDGYEKVWRE